MPLIHLNGKPVTLDGAIVAVRDLVTRAGRDHRDWYLAERIVHDGRHRWIDHRNRAAVLDCRRDRWFEVRKA
jgi:hypothetical protein